MTAGPAHVMFQPLAPHDAHAVAGAADFQLAPHAPQFMDHSASLTESASECSR